MKSHRLTTVGLTLLLAAACTIAAIAQTAVKPPADINPDSHEIGRASCRERVYSIV
jgi:Spy/CpxP family protein refolding chaperone